MRSLKISLLASLVSVALYFIPLFAFTQIPDHVISGKVVSAADGSAISFASVQLGKSGKGAITDGNGRFSIHTVSPRNQLVISFLGYQRRVISLESIPEKELIIKLTPSSGSLKEVVIRSEREERIVDRPFITVLDYDFIGDNILMATMKFRLNKSQLSLLTPDRDTLCQVNIPGIPSRIFRDCFDNIQLVCEDTVYQVYYDGYEIQLIYPVSLASFEKNLLPCVAQDDDNLYFEVRIGRHKVEMSMFNFYTNNHEVDFVRINKYSGKRSPFMGVKDKEVLEMVAREEYRMQFALSSFDMESSRIFDERVLFKEIYAPLIGMRDSLYIFSAPDSSLLCFSNGGLLNRSTTMRYHNEHGWRRDLIVDQEEDNVYTRFENNGVVKVKQIDLLSGGAANSTTLPGHFAENVKVNKGYIYFLYHYPGDQHTFLSRVKVGT